MDGNSAERWLPVPGFEGYEVSDLGRVRSWRKRGRPFQDGRWRLDAPRLLTMPIAKNGYRGAVWRDPRDRHSWVFVYVHRLVLLAFVGPLPGGLETRHINGDRLDNRLVNLAYGTSSENAQDMVRHGRTHNQHQWKTHCPKSHAYDEANTYRRRDGGRTCRSCENDRGRAQRARMGLRERPMFESPACSRGHPFDEANTYVWRGRRQCRTCNREYQRGWRARS